MNIDSSKYVVTPGQGEVITLGPPNAGKIIITVDPKNTGETRFCMLIQVLDPGAVVPVHLHVRPAQASAQEREGGTLMKTLAQLILTVLALLCVATGPTLAQTAAPQQPPPDAATTPLFVNVQDLKWKISCPELGDRSSAGVILHVDPKTQATKLLIRVPKNWEVPKHWHTANETHTVISGTFVFECDGKQEEQGPGSFNYIPRKMIHQGWTKDEESVLFITVDGAWDINFVGRSSCEVNKDR